MDEEANPMISTRSLKKIPRPHELKKNCFSLALITEILDIDAFFQYRKNGPEEFDVATLDNGEGDWVKIYFFHDAVFVLGLDHHSLMASESGRDFGVASDFPKQKFKKFYEEILDEEFISFLLWNVGEGWKTSNVDFPPTDKTGDFLEDPDGSEMFLSPFAWNASQYAQFAKEYYDLELPIGALDQIFDGNAIDSELIHKINPGLVPDDIFAWIRDNQDASP